MAGLETFIQEDDETEYHLFQIEYEEQFDEPIVHIWARDQNDEQVWIEVEGHYPSFYIHEDAFSKRVINHQWVRGVEDGYTSIHGDPLVKVECKLPKHVGGSQDKKGLREYFETTWEADVFYTSLFLIDTGIKTHFKLDRDDGYTGQHIDGDFRIHVDDITAIEEPDWRATPRMTTIDIEVLSPDGFPEPDEAEHPVTAITSHDNYTDDYDVWVLRHPEWEHSDTEVSNIAIEHRPDGVNINDVRVFTDESSLLHSFNEYVANKNPDLLSGWNSSTTDNGKPFDYPYLINRCQSLNVMNYRDWSPMGQVWDGSWGPSGKGVAFFDMLKGYKKTQWQKPKGGYGLENIAGKELDYGKEEIDDIDDAWKSDIGTFLKYNIRDVSAVIGINKSADVVDLFQNIRKLAGCQFEDSHNPIDTLDILFLRHAKKQSLVLPTNTVPDRDWYYGAFVFDSSVGRHRNVVYFDVSSLYPNIMRQTNISPETIVGTHEDLEASQYTEDDCQWAYIDTRQTNVKKSSDPDFEKCYYLKPSVKEGFVKSVIDELLELKDFYDGKELYSAVKRLVNAVYGCLGDANSYGKGFRLFDWRMAESVTLQGRKIIQECAEWGTDRIDGGYVTNGDTDGFGITMGDEQSHESVVDDALGIEDEMTNHIQGWCNETLNIEESTIVMEAEKLMDPIFVPQGTTTDEAPKKKYAYVKWWEQ